MPKVTIIDTGNTVDAINAAIDYEDTAKGLYVSTADIREMLRGGSDKLILSIRDSIIVKALRSKRNILVGGHNTIEQIERIAEVVEAQEQIDNQYVLDDKDKVKYIWKVKKF